MSPKLGPIGDWGLEIEKNAIKVNNALDYQTNIPGIYAIGDVNTYPGKLKLILCGFHEATLMCQSAYKRIFPNKKYVNEWLNMPLDSQKIRSPEQLILPHPRIQDRSFVLIPLNDIEPNWVHPILNKSTHEMLGELSTDETIGISCFT